MNAPDRWRRVEALYHTARERDVEERAAFLDAACKGDAALRREVESLLAQSPSTDGSLSEPAMAVAAPLITNPAATVLIGRRIGAYHVQTLLGAGGMGEVYRAHDTKLGRDVAIKILPRVFTSDPERLARFEREARVLASLNHPNIATIHGIEDLDGLRALILELVEGETLAEQVQRGALPIADALAVARQIVDALDAAHERGIVHRDLKPANIKVTTDGVVKVLDFGLAKVSSGDGAVSDLSHSPTVTIGGTREGMILGTAAYMSPEQARGKPVDKRADIWAFGCVLYEMLTGRAVFSRETVSDTIAAILERDPDWTALPVTTPASARRLLHRCFEKDPKARLRDIGDARVELDDRASSPTEDFPLAPRRIPIAIALATGILLGAVAVFAIVRSRPATPAGGATRFTFTAPEEAPQISNWPVPSPDGRQIAFVAENAAGQKALWIRSIDSPTPRRIGGTEGAEHPFWSPDAAFVGFGAAAQGRLKKVYLSQGHVQNICNIADAFIGATWNQHGVIVFAPDNRVPLLRVSTSGGTPEPVTALDPERRENSHRWPHFLPDGRHFLYTARSDVRENTGIFVGTLDTKDRTWLMEAQSNAVYAAPGYVLFVREGTLLAQRFDAATVKLSGEPFALAGNVSQNSVGAAASFSVSADGRVVAYRTDVEQTSQLVWLDRSGAKLGATIVEGPFNQLQLAPDGQRAAVIKVDRDTGNRDIWLVDVTTGTLTRFTSHPANDWFPIWSPDGAHVTFASDRNGMSTVYRKAADGSGPEELIPTPNPDGNTFPDDWSQDGRLLAVHVSTPLKALDVWVVPTDDRKPYGLAQSEFQEQNAAFSPDGRWVAYVSDESGAPEVYVQALGKAGKQRVSTAGGMRPRWRRDGRELFFINAAGKLMAVEVRAGDGFMSSPPVALFDACGPSTPQYYRYAVAADGARTLWLCPTPRVAPSLVTVSIDWAAH